MLAALIGTGVLGEAVALISLSVPAWARPLTAADAKGSAAAKCGAAAVGVAAGLAAAGVVSSSEAVAAFAGIAAVIDMGGRTACKPVSFGSCLGGNLTAAFRVPAAGPGCRGATAPRGP